MNQSLEEQLADLEHASWSRWMVYLFNTCGLNNDGTVTIPKDLVDRWEKQTLTDYKDLTEHEKQMDRDEIQPILTLILAEKRQVLEEILPKLEGLATNLGTMHSRVFARGVIDDLKAQLEEKELHDHIPSLTGNGTCEICGEKVRI